MTPINATNVFIVTNITLLSLDLFKNFSYPHVQGSTDLINIMSRAGRGRDNRDLDDCRCSRDESRLELGFHPGYISALFDSSSPKVIVTVRHASGSH